MTSFHYGQGIVLRASDTSAHLISKVDWWSRYCYHMPTYEGGEWALERASNLYHRAQMRFWGLDLWGGDAWRPRNYPQNMHVWVSMLFLRMGGGKGLAKGPWRLSAWGSKSAQPEPRRLVWQQPIVSHLLNGGTRQILHVLFRGQTYWTGSFNLKT